MIDLENYLKHQAVCILLVTIMVFLGHIHKYKLHCQEETAQLIF